MYIIKVKLGNLPELKTIGDIAEIRHYVRMYDNVEISMEQTEEITSRKEDGQTHIFGKCTVKYISNHRVFELLGE